MAGGKSSSLFRMPGVAMINRRTHLDFARGVAALAVCAGHLRAFQFVAFQQVEEPTIVDRAFYWATGCGHQAVMIFFVLSGYFIAGSVADSVARQRWSWGGYASRRLTRLWLVLIPALLLTLVWDVLGMRLAGGAGYDGRFADVLFSGPSPDRPHVINCLSFLGNVAFLQTIVCPVLGSNSPLWSLANEFWYYVLFPLAFPIFVSSSSWPRRLILVFLCGGIVLCLPAQVMVGFMIWLLGYAVHVAMKSPPCVRFLTSRIVFSVFSILFIGSLLVTRSSTSAVRDFMVALAFAGMLPFLVVCQPSQGLYSRIATGLSEISYTLYVVHFPMLAFLFFSFRLPEKSAPSLGNYFTFCFLLLVTLVYGALVWWLFEKRTDSVRKQIESCIGSFTGRKSQVDGRSQ